MFSLFPVKLQALGPATLFKKDFSTAVFLRILQNFYEKLFLQKTSVASVDLLFLLKNNEGSFLLHRFVDLYVIYTLKVETIPTHFY